MAWTQGLGPVVGALLLSAATVVFHAEAAQSSPLYPVACVSNCSEGFYLAGRCTDFISPSCEPCHPSCATCRGPAAHECTGCPPHFTLTAEGTCDDPCTTSYDKCTFDDIEEDADSPKSRERRKGKPKAGSATSAPSPSKSKDASPAKSKDASKCDPTDPSVTVCKSCHKTCSECWGPGSHRCLRCSGSLYLSRGRCVKADKCGWDTFALTRPGDNECRRCRAACPAGEYETAACTATSDRLCSPWTRCEPGEREVVAPTNTSDRVCEPCEPETYQTLPDQLSCLPWTVCQPGSRVTVTPTLARNRECTQCLPGTVSNGTNAPTCDACVLGEFQAEGNRTGEGTACTPRKWVSGLGSGWRQVGRRSE